MIHDYIGDIAHADEICEEFVQFVRDRFFTGSNGSWQDYANPYHWPYLPSARPYLVRLSRLVEICDLFGIVELESARSDLQRKIHILEEEREETRSRPSFSRLMEQVEKPFADAKEKLQKVAERLEPKERERVNEALHVYLEGAYYSSVAMSVSAIEHRLLNLMKVANPEEANRLDHMTLGSLIEECLDPTRSKYQDILPRRHYPLLRLCNEYRVFSVHPKEEGIDRKVATSVLNLTLEFLLDPKTRLMAPST